MTRMIEANTTIPTKKTETFSTASDNQPSVEIHILQGERPMAPDNKSLGKFHLDGIPPAPRGVPQIEVEFNIDANGILNVSAKDKASGKSQSIRIESSSGLSDEEINNMREEAERNAEADKQRAEQIDQLNQADSLIFNTEKQLNENADKLAENTKEALQKNLDALKEVHKNQEFDKLEEAIKNLTDAWNVASQELYQQAAQQQGAEGAAGAEGATGGENPGGGAAGGDDVSDVDYEEVK